MSDQLVERCVAAPLGVVIIGLQQSRLDGSCSLRLFGECDNIMMEMTRRLDLRHDTPSPSHMMLTHALIPYDVDGNVSDRHFSCLDLSTGTQLRLHSRHNCQVNYEIR